MQPKQKLRRCFIIGPMKNMARMMALKNDIINPLLEPYGFKVITPDEGEIGNVMRLILLNLEQADLLIADITGNNANVLYELGVYHSFGKPCIVVKDKSAATTMEQTPFDIAHYRYHEVDFDNLQLAKAMLKPLLEDIIKKIDVQDWFPNPVTDFYQSPVAEIPTAVGLSKNYIKNFMRMALPFIFQKDEKGKEYRTEVWVETGEKEMDDQSQFRLLNSGERQNMKLEILVPVKMTMASHDYISGLKNIEKISYKSAEIGRRTRPFRLHYYQNNGQYCLVDIPTILSTLNESIVQRRKLHKDQFDPEDWIILEQQELERFASKCEIYLTDLFAQYPETKNRAKIVWGWDPENDL